jgi:hypothetical protein
MEKEMKELYVEGVATHDGPESCVGVRKAAGEALTGVRAGWAIEPRNQPGPGCRRFSHKRKATPPVAPSRAAGGPCGVGEPTHARNLHAREPGGPMPARLADHQPGRSGKAKAAILRCTDMGSQTCP